MNVAVFVVPAYEPPIDVTVCAATADVAIAKLALALPAGTLTLAGTDTAALALESDIVVGAVALRVSVTRPVAPLPATTALGAALTDASIEAAVNQAVSDMLEAA